MDIEKFKHDEFRQEYLEEVKLFIDYGVASEEKDVALKSLSNYENNTMALLVQRDFYSRLPELREEAIVRVSRIISRKGMYLLGVKTASYEYLYFFNGEDVFYLGEKKDGIGDSDVLSFFGYVSNDDFLKKMSGEEGEDALVEEDKVFCPACGVATGEFHELGCPVEICPWCDGQLNYCNCRFEKLGVDEIVEDAEIDRLEILLNEKGRIRFAASQAPSYPSAGDLDEEE